MALAHPAEGNLSAPSDEKVTQTYCYPHPLRSRLWRLTDDVIDPNADDLRARM